MRDSKQIHNSVTKPAQNLYGISCIPTASRIVISVSSNLTKYRLVHLNVELILTRDWHSNHQTGPRKRVIFDISDLDLLEISHSSVSILRTIVSHGRIALLNYSSFWHWLIHMSMSSSFFGETDYLSVNFVTFFNAKSITSRI